MARTIAEIYDSMIAIKQGESSLEGLTPAAGEQFVTLASELDSQSKVSRWRLLVYLQALGIFVLEKLFDIYQAQVNQVIAAAPYGNAAWLKQRVLDFQYPDTLTMIGNVPGYAEIDEDKQIVRRVAIVGQDDGSVIIKAAKVDGETINPLTTEERAGLLAYLVEISWPGLIYQVLSQPADQLRITGKVIFDAGLLEADVALNVEASLQAYLANLAFNGAVQYQLLVDAIQAAEGVVDVQIDEIAGKAFSAGSYTPFNLSYPTNAGYAVIDPALSSTLSYEPNV